MDPWNKPPKSPWERRPNPPNIDEVLNQLQNNLKNKFNGRNLPLWLLLIALGLWLATGFFIVEPQELAVVKRFGKFHRVENPGPHLALPVPIESVIKENVTTVRRVEIGFRTIDFGPPARYRQVKNEALMLTGDENIIDIQFTVQYKISNIQDYFFNMTEVGDTVRSAAESAMREVIGRTTVDDALTVGKGIVETTTAELLQDILDTYRSGIHIENVKLQDVHPPDPVKEAFKDVASAKEDREKLINQAHGYQNDLIPKARGEAAQMLNSAHAYAQQTVMLAEGKAKRFNSIYEEYHQAKDITRQRIQIETMEAVLPNINKVLVDPQLGKNFLPFLPLQQLPKTPEELANSKKASFEDSQKKASLEENAAKNK